MKDPVARFPLLCLLGIIVLSVIAHPLKNIAVPFLSVINIFSGPVWDTLKIGLIVGLIGTVVIFFVLLYLMSVAPTPQAKQQPPQRLHYFHPYLYHHQDSLADYYLLHYKKHAAVKNRQQQAEKSSAKKAQIIQFPKK